MQLVWTPGAADISFIELGRLAVHCSARGTPDPPAFTPRGQFID